MFDPEFAFDVPTGSSLLAEVGIRPEHVREVVEDERAIRCPDRGAAYPVHGFANLDPDSSLDHGLHEPGPKSPGTRLRRAVRQDGGGGGLEEDERKGAGERDRPVRRPFATHRHHPDP